MSVQPLDVPSAAPYDNPVLPSIPTTGALGSLDILNGYRKVKLHQQMDLIEAATLIDMPNKYIVYNMDEQPLMYINEVPTGVPYRYRALDVVAKDPAGQKLFHITRPSKACSLQPFCCAFMGPCKYEGDVRLYDQNEKHLGHLTQKGSFASARLEVEEKDGDCIYKIKEGNACCRPATDYDILNDDDDKVGKIEKQGIGIGFGSNMYEIKLHSLSGTLITFWFILEPAPQEEEEEDKEEEKEDEEEVEEEEEKEEERKGEEEEE
ncbi:hypothetical protein PoB_002295400 [Plakobranchus ocellatus]|uniref:Phospholipid scramblase n=1 Tax=Plakobranchus ocellatus TaxID=259542 RepID=A0AAV3ZMB2_9GAST|nr:hypothetical protein PoB_002295400 [Plakobranchus ocellatus]